MPKRGPKWSPADYTPFYLLEEPTHTPKEIRTEYSRLRTQLIHRVERMEAAGIGSAQAEYVRKMLPTLKDLEQMEPGLIYETKYVVDKKTGKTKRKRVSRPRTKLEELAYRLSEARSIELERGYSLKGIKEIQKTINKETGELVPLGEVLDFRDYMKSWRQSAFYKTIVGSGEAAAYHDNEYQDIGGSFTDFYTLFKSESYGG